MLTLLIADRIVGEFQEEVPIHHTRVIITPLSESTPCYYLGGLQAGFRKRFLDLGISNR